VLRPNIDVRWHPPSAGWTKINIDGSCIGSPSYGSIGGVYRNSQCVFLGRFVQDLGNAFSLITELSAAMFAI